jgi:hypothetical protein
MSVRNSIFIGFEWSQGFIVPVEIVSVNDSLRIDWKKDRNGLVLIRSTQGLGVARDNINPDQYIVQFEQEQTAELTPGRLVGEFVVEYENGSERIIGTQVVVPIVKPFAEPTL